MAPLGVTVGPATVHEVTSAEWDEAVSRSPQGTVFHLSAALDVLAEHAGATLHRLAAFKGQELRGIVPLFELDRGPLTTVFSPPPKLGVPYLGPAMVNCEKLKRRKHERTNRALVEGTLDWLRNECAPSYIHLETTPAYTDLRPFTWNDFSVRPRYTYELDLTAGADGVLASFHRDLRSNITRHEASDYDVFEGGDEAIEFVVEQVRERFAAQGESYALEPSYVTDLYRALGPDRFRPYVGSCDGEWLGGVIVPSFDGQIRYWQGGGKPSTDLPINDLIHWQVIRDAIDRGMVAYDLTGANRPRIARYKAKFNPALVPYYEVEWGTRTMTALARLYRTFR